ncbi:mitochondrial ribosomal protein L27 precursor, putative [Plasmodium relictum]|uniref:Mitochondrial ribosomal protein L27, putative n=1 Tax=Plasmodium relictum TaxID=85471 RepID=A0A1J1H1M1_PLARL|nr:mitochondrial ribosomal protein L27 precursor, putative [Plasmodium relictum]CRG98755.1 mitochondrial ribosomal protein L27 precursor, putative [Plasmodium relictum]
MITLFPISKIFNKINEKQCFNNFNLLNKRSILMSNVGLRCISTSMNNINLIIKKNIFKNNINKFNLTDKKSVFINNIRCCYINTNINKYMQNDKDKYFFKIFKRNKMVKTSSYRRKSRSSPNGQGQKAKIGIKRLSGEYVKTGQMLVKQRKIIAFNYEKKTRKRNFKYYPGENVKVSKNTSLIALTNGRVKYTFHVIQNILIVNILPEELEELKEEDLYRYRTEHVKSFEENRSLIYLRMKNVITFPKFKKTQYIKPPLKPQFLTKYDIYDNPTLQKVPILYHKKK